MPLHYIPNGLFPEVKPGQTHLLLGWATTWDKISILRFPALGGPVGQNAKCKKVAHLSEETCKKKLRTSIPDSVVTFFSLILGPLAPGNRVFLFLAQSRNFSKSPQPKTGQNTTKSPFPTSGGPTGKKVVPEKVAENYPGYRGNTFFSIFGPLLLC